VVRTLISLLPRVLGSWRGAARAKLIATLLGLGAIFAAGATQNALLANLRNWVFDAYERLLPRSPPTAHALTIDIDSESIRHLGQ
jgi:CHASE2 domain-containing sensor protein